MDRLTGKVYLVTGASSGIGRVTARALAQAGAVVYGASRRLPEPFEPDGSGSFHPIIMDTTSDESVNAGIDTIISEQGTVYGIINCAGSGIAGALEDCSSGEVLSQFDVNTVGALRTARAAFPKMRENKEGVIINIGSIGGDFALPYQGLYSMSKAALRKQTEVLRMEMKRFGIQLCVIEPGDLKTGFTAARKTSKATEGSVHEAAAKRAVEQMAKDEQGGKDPVCVTDLIMKILKRKKLPACKAVGGIYVFFPILGRLLPYSLVETIIGSMYHV